MSAHNARISEALEQLADLLEIEGANPFRVRAYRNAARVVANRPENIADLIAHGGTLVGVPGIGKDLGGKIAEIAKTGSLPLLDSEMKKIPIGMLEILKVPGLGPKRVKILRDELGIKGTADLEKAVEEGRIRRLPGFGAVTEKRIREELARRKSTPNRMLLFTAEQVVQPLLEEIQRVKGVNQAIVAGSFRRRQETVGDLDILASCRSQSPVMKTFVEYEEVAQVLSQGPTRSSVLLRSGLQVDLRAVEEASYGAALHYFTGSKAHNIAIRSLGVKRGLKINEYGIFKRERRVGGVEENDVFRKVGLPYIEPELRENRGEIEAAQEGRLPELVTEDDLRGDLHVHTEASDGQDTIVDMAAAAQKKGYDYIAITDHSQRLTVAKGLNSRRYLQQMKEIDRLNRRLRGIRILKAAEVDILEDGSLDLPDDTLKLFDLTVCSVHHKFDLPVNRQTERVIRAMDNPYFNILAHPTGRLIGERQPYAIDLERVMKAARERNCIIELNAQPTRLDLSDIYCRMAKEIGVRIAISTDSHSTTQLSLMRFGIAQARRGWLEARDVVNTAKLGELRKILHRS